jgi:hypothetical protein
MPGATLAMALAEAGAGRPHEGRRMGGILRRASLLSDGGEASIAIDGDHPPLTVSARFGSVECTVRRKFIRAAHFAPFRSLTPGPPLFSAITLAIQRPAFPLRIWRTGAPRRDPDS